MRVRFFNKIFIAVFMGLFFLWVPRLFSEPGTLLAKVGNVVITQADLDEQMKKYAQFKGDKPFTPEEKKFVLDHLIKVFLIDKAAEVEKLDQKPEIQAEIKIRRSELLNQEYINTKVKPFITVTDKEVEEKFKENPFLVPKEVFILREVLVKTEAEANTIYETLKKSENLRDSFALIATEKSTAPSKVHGGQRRPVSPGQGQLPGALEEVVLKMKQGDMSKPIKTDEGYYILYFESRKERTPEEIKNLETTIKNKITQIEINKKTHDVLEKKVEELKKNIKVEVYYDRIKKE